VSRIQISPTWLLKPEGDPHLPFLPANVVDPDPHGSELIFVGWIRNRFGNADPDPGDKKRPIKIEKVKKFHVLIF
jgi:hypothetical protein